MNNDTTVLTCFPHIGEHRMYCFNCKVVVCDNCSREHTENKHKTDDIYLVANSYRDCINKDKETITKKVSELIEYIRDYKIEVTTKISKDLEVIEEMLNTLLNEIDIKKENLKGRIDNNFSDIINSLENEYFLNEFDNMLKIIDDVSLTINQEKIKEISYESIKRMYENKLSKIEEITEITSKNIDDIRKISNHYDKQKDIVKNVKDISFMRLKEQMMNDINQILDLGLMLGELKSANNYLIEHNKGIAHEKFRLIIENNNMKEKILERKKQMENSDELLINLEKEININKNKISSIQAEEQSIRQSIRALNTLYDSKQKIYESMSIESQEKDTGKELKTFQIEEFEMLTFAEVIYIFDQKNYKIWIYHFDLKKAIRIDNIKTSLPSNYGAVQIKNSYYMSGGFDLENVSFSTKTTKISFFSIESINVEQMENMIMGKSHHKMIIVNLKTILSIGGKIEKKKWSKVCEFYYIDKNNWKQAPSLNEEKISVSATTFNCSTVYVFGGFKGKYSNVIEYLYIDDLKKGWIAIKINSSQKILQKEEMGCVKISEEGILLFGGAIGSEGSVKDTSIYNIKTKEFIMHRNLLCKSDWFAMQTPIRVNKENIFIAGYFLGDIHHYNTKSMSWNLIDYDTWKK